VAPNTPTKPSTGFLGYITLTKVLPWFTALFPFIEFFWVYLTNDIQTATMRILEKVFAAELTLERIAQIAELGEPIGPLLLLSALHSFFIAYYAIKLTTEALFWLTGQGVNGLPSYLAGFLIFALAQSFYVYAFHSEFFIPVVDGAYTFTTSLPLIASQATLLPFL